MKRQLIFYFLLCAFNAFSFGIKNKTDKIIDKKDSTRVNSLLAEAKNYENNKDYDNAIKTTKSALDIADKIDHNYGKYRCYVSLINLYRQTGNLLKRKEYVAKLAFFKPEKETKNTDDAAQKEKDAQIKAQQELLMREQQELQRRMNEIEKLNQDKSISKEEIEKRKLELQKMQMENNAKMQTINLQAATISETTNKLSMTQQELLNEKLNLKVFEDSLKLTKQETELANSKIKTQKLFNYILILGISAMLILALSFFRLYKMKQRTQDLLLVKNTEIESEKKRSDDLLLNILPNEVANELKINGKSEPKYFEKVTVMFTDFKDFTTISEKISPKKLVEEIDFIFREFDAIIEKHNLEKIKTIGDAYLCASGLPDANTHSAMNVAKAALEIQAFIKKVGDERRKNNLPFFDIRIGLNSGPLVAGIVGAKKFAYDIWGDTVNTAARMEQNSEPGKINISGTTFELLKNQAECTHRGKISAKNKGDIDMYFLNRIIEL